MTATRALLALDPVAPIPIGLRVVVARPPSPNSLRRGHAGAVVDSGVGKSRVKPGQPLTPRAHAWISFDPVGDPRIDGVRGFYFAEQLDLEAQDDG